MHTFTINHLIKYALMLIILFSVSHVPGLSFTAVAKQPVVKQPGYTVETLEKGVDISFSTGEISWRKGDQGVIPHIDQFSTENRTGFPQLPFLSVPFAIPAGASLQLKVETAPAQRLKSPSKIPIAPQPDGVRRNSASEMIGGDWAPAQQNRSAELAPIIVEEIGVMRGVKLGRVAFYPLTYEGEDLMLAPSASVKINFVFDTNLPPPESQSKEIPPFFSNTIHSVVVNPEHVALGLPKIEQSTTNGPTDVDGMIVVEKAGMTRLTGQDLLNAGYDLVDFDPQTVELSHLGVSVPIQWMGDGDNEFSAEESLIFYAPPFGSRWTRGIPIVLRKSGSSARAMETRPGTPPGGIIPISAKVKTLIEQNPLYGPDCGCGNLPLGHDGDRWVWQELKRPGTSQVSVDALLNNLGDSGQASLTVHWIGFTSTNSDVDHAVRILLNNTEIGTAEWDGKTAHSETFNLPNQHLQQSNKVTLELVENGSTGIIDGVWLDALEFEYIPTDIGLPEQTHYFGHSSPTAYSISLPFNEAMMIYDVTDPLNPQYLTATSRGVGEMTWGDASEANRTYAMVPADRYLSPVSIQNTAGLNATGSNGATYVMVAPAEFADSDALAQLADLRKAEGWQVVIETAEEIYSSFGHGEPSPDAIKDYLTWGYEEWSIQPEMVLLIGDGNTDPKKNRSDSRDSFIPPYLAQVDPWLGETAADNQYVTVDGDDALPDIIIGRLPANSSAELESMVNKITTYEQHESAESWNQDVLMVADNNDSAGNFSASSDNIISHHLRFPWIPDRHYFGIDSADSATFNSEIVTSWNTGYGLVVYSGHSTNHQWAGERLLHLDDVSSLNNSERLPFVLQLTCLTGAFHSTAFNSMDEQLVRQADGGAIAVVSSTGLGVATGHDQIADGLLSSIYGERNSNLGTAFLNAKLELATQNRSSLDLLDTYVLLGDPALNINLNTDIKTSFLPGVFN